MSVSDESGFEVGAAYVTVSPDAADFPDQLDEQIGGLTVSVRVLPDISDFQGAIDEEDLSADVRLIASLGGFEDQVDEAVGGMTATIAVGADVATARSEVAGVIDDFDSARADLTLGANTGAGRAQAEAFATDLSGLSADVTIGADIGAVSPGVERLTGDLDQLSGSGEHAQSVLSGVGGEVSNLGDLADHAASALSGISGILAGVGGGVSVQLIPDTSGLAASLASDAEGLTVGVEAVLANADEFRQAVEEQAGGAEVSVSLDTTIANADEFRQAVEEQAGGMSVGVRIVPEGVAEDERGALAAEAAPAVSVGEGLTGAEEQAGGLAGALTRVGDAGSGAGTAVADGLAQAERAMRDVDAVVDQAVGHLGNLQAMAADGGAWTSGLSEAEGKIDAVGERLASLNAVWADLFTASAGGEGDLASMAQEADELTGSIRAVMADANEAGQAVRGIEDAFAQAASAAREAAAEEAAANEEAAGRSLGAWTSAVEGFTERTDSILGGLRITLDSMMAAPPTSGWLESAEEVGGRVDALRSKMSAVSDAAQAIGQDIAAGGGDFESLAGDAARVDEVIGTMKNDVLAVREAAMGVRSEFIDMAGASGAGGVAVATSGIGGAAEDAGKAAEGLGGIFGGLAGRLSYMAVDPFMWMMAVPMMIGPIEQGIKSLGAAMNPVSGQVQELHQQVDQQTAALGFSVEGWKNLAESEKAYGAATGSPLISQETNTAVRDLSAGAENLSGHLSELGQRYDLTTTQSEALAAASGVSAKQLAGGGAAADTAMAKIEAYANANLSALGPVGELSGDMVTFGNDTLTAQSRITALDDAYGLLVGNFVGAEQAQLTTAQGFLTLASDASQSGASMTGTNQASYALQQQFYSQITATDQTVDAMVKQKDSTKEVNAYLQQQIDKLKGYAGDSEPAQQALARLAKLHQGMTKATKDNTAAQGGLIGKLREIPRNIEINLTELAKGTWSEAELLKTGHAYVPGLAGGGLIRGGSGSPTADDIPLWASSDEYMVQADAVHHYGVGMMDAINAKHFAGGGLVGGSYTGTPQGLGSWTQQQFTASENALASALIDSASAAANPAGAVGKALTGATGSVQAMAQKAAAALGWTGAQWAALNTVEMDEAGWNLTATNPTSGAYGIAQFINGPGEYAQYGGNANTAAGQITAFLNYVLQRYGNPEAAAQHEAQYHWYKNGGRLNPGQSAIVGDGGLPEVVTAGMSGATVTPMSRGGNVQNFNFYGTQYPTNEQIAAMKMEFAIAQVSPP